MVCPRWPVICARPYQGTGDGWAAADQAGHERTAHEGRHEKMGHARHGVPPCLTSCDDVGSAHVPVCQGLLRIPQDIIMR